LEQAATLQLLQQVLQVAQHRLDLIVQQPVVLVVLLLLVPALMVVEL
jgi:hypothetical protein